MPKKISNITLSFLSSLMLSTSLYAVGGDNPMVKSDDEEGRDIKRLYPRQKLKDSANVIDLANFNATQGIVIQGAEQKDGSGGSVSFAGDVNADGINDVIVGAPGVNSRAGASYVIYGRKGGYPDPINLTNLNATQGFIIQGARFSTFSGYSVSYAGDMNDDGINDVVVGAWGVNFNAGSSYVIYGKKGGYPDPINLASLNATQGFVIQGAQPLDGSGFSVSYAGDMNGDGLNDIIVGAFGVNNDVGASYVIYGRKGGYSSPINLANLNPTQGFAILGPSFSFSGNSASYAGDMNGDGLNDVIVDAPLANNNAGISYVIYGRKGGYADSINLANLNPTQGFAILGAASGEKSGLSVSFAGDMNGDGLNDVIVGAPGVNGWAGTSYVVYGRKGGYPNPVNLDTFPFTSSQGFAILGAASGDQAGTSVSYVGDMNGDGLNEVIVGAPYVNNSAGASYVIYGKKGGYPEPLNLANLTATQGLIIQGAKQGDGAAIVGFARDMNGDRLNDIVIGAPGVNNGAGASYIIYGNKSFTDFGSLPWTVNQEVKNKPRKAKSTPREKISSKSIIRAEKTSKFRSVEDKESAPVLPQSTKDNPSENSLPDATSDTISSHHIPWYSSAKWVTALKSLWQGSSQVLDTTDPQVEALVKLQVRCDRLIDKADSETADKWYRFSLEDLHEDITETLKNPHDINENTNESFYKRLGGIEKDFLREPLLERPSFFAASNHVEEPLGHFNKGIELLPVSIPLLGSGVVPLALGR